MHKTPERKRQDENHQLKDREDITGEIIDRYARNNVDIASRFVIHTAVAAVGPVSGYSLIRQLGDALYCTHCDIVYLHLVRDVHSVIGPDNRLFHLQVASSIFKDNSLMYGLFIFFQTLFNRWAYILITDCSSLNVNRCRMSRMRE